MYGVMPEVMLQRRVHRQRSERNHKLRGRKKSIPARSMKHCKSHLDWEHGSFHILGATIISPRPVNESIRRACR